jgi:hypothetical protein
MLKKLKELKDDSLGGSALNFEFRNFELLKQN